MISPARIGWLWGGIAVVVVVVAGGLYFNAAIDVRTDAFRTTAELRAWALADRVAFELGRDADESRLALLTRAFVIPGGSVLYAQVLEHGKPLVEANLLDSAIPPSRTLDRPFHAEELLIEQRSVWDVQQALPDDHHVVRIGLSAGSLNAAIRDQTILVVGIGVTLVALIVGATLATAARSATDRADTSARAETATAATPASIPAAGPEPNAEGRIGQLIIDDTAKRVELQGRPVELSPKEFELLSLLAENPGQVYGNDEILKRVWPDNHLAGSQDVKQYIYFLRQKLEETPKAPKRIVTVRGFGYRLEVDL